MAWMHAFSQTRPPELRAILEQSLSGDKPAKTFGQVLRALPDEHAQWSNALVSHVRDAVERWRDDHDLDISIDKAESASAGPPRAAG